MTSKPQSVFSRNLVHIRKQRGLSQGDLANLTGLTRRIISHYETQATQPPVENLELIAKALGITTSQLLAHSEQEETPLVDLSEIDPRSVKKLKDILSLSPEDRNDLYRMLNKLLRKNQLERERQKASG